MKNITKSFMFILLVTILLGSSVLAGCRNPFIDNIVSEEASGSNSGSGSGSNSGSGSGSNSGSEDDSNKTPSGPEQSEPDVLVDAKSPFG